MALPVFLGARGQTFCRYPTAKVSQLHAICSFATDSPLKLGDFGCAINVPPNDTRTFDALDHGDMGTECNRPPVHLTGQFPIMIHTLANSENRSKSTRDWPEQLVVNA